MTVIKGDCRELIKTVPKDAFIISDPPYNQRYHYSTYKDALGAGEYIDLLRSVFHGRKSVVIHYPEETVNLLGGGGLGRCEEVVSWVYNSNTAKQSRLITWWNCKPDFRRVPQPYKNPTDKRIAARIAAGKSARGYDWWNIDQVKNVSKATNPHPCPIPLELAERLVLSTTQPGDLVCDPFAGSGTVGVAALKHGRRFVGFEMDAEYVAYANSLFNPTLPRSDDERGMKEITKQEIFERYGSGIEFIFKGNEPFVADESSQVPMGVLLANEEGKVLCYECKEWFVSVSNHVHSHKISVEEYRKKYGYNETAGLVSRSLSKKIAGNNIARDSVSKMLPARMAKLEEASQKLRKPRQSMQRKNASNTCPAQYKARYIAACLEEGRAIGAGEIRKKDLGVSKHFTNNKKSFRQFRQEVAKELGLSTKRKKRAAKTCCGSNGSRHLRTCLTI